MSPHRARPPSRYWRFLNWSETHNITGLAVVSAVLGLIAFAVLSMPTGGHNPDTVDFRPLFALGAAIRGAFTIAALVFIACLPRAIRRNSAPASAR